MLHGIIKCTQNFPLAALTSRSARPDPGPTPNDGKSRDKIQPNGMPRFQEVLSKACVFRQHSTLLWSLLALAPFACKARSKLECFSRNHIEALYQNNMEEKEDRTLGKCLFAVSVCRLCNV